MRSIIWALIVTSGVLLLAGGCWHNPRTSSNPAAGPSAQAEFVGNAKCAGCHQAEFKSHLGSRHANTLVPVSRKRLSSLAPPQGKIPGTGFTLTLKDERYAVADPSQSDEAVLLDYALGSGKTGMTYVSLIGPDRLAEFRMSYFPHQKKWYITPGQESMESDSLGKVHPNDFSRKCLLCHSVSLPANTLQPEERFLGVGCESCHGAGSAHIEAMTTGKRNLASMEKLASWSATRLNDLCAKCHGTASDAEATAEASGSTNRFQVYGLMKSQCFKQSKDTLSCITCHDPHTNASSNKKTYEAACLKCHTSSPPSHSALPSQFVAGKSCSVNPKSGCIACHMPSRKAISNTHIPTMMADHFIRIHH